MSGESELEQLLAKIEAATGPNLALELEIARVVLGAETPRWMHGTYLQNTPPPYTASLDAAVALVERLYATEHRSAIILAGVKAWRNEDVSYGSPPSRLPRFVLIELLHSLIAEKRHAAV